jgi:hypothetical protein
MDLQYQYQQLTLSIKLSLSIEGSLWMAMVHLPLLLKTVATRMLQQGGSPLEDLNSGFGKMNIFSVNPHRSKATFYILYEQL